MPKLQRSCQPSLPLSAVSDPDPEIHWKKRQETEPNRPNQTEPNRLILEPAGTRRGTETSRTGPSHDASEKRRPNRDICSPEPNRTEGFSKSLEPKRIEPNRFLPAISARVARASSPAVATRARARPGDPWGNPCSASLLRIRKNLQICVILYFNLEITILNRSEPGASRPAVPAGSRTESALGVV